MSGNLIRLTEMAGIAQGEVKSMTDLIALHRKNNTRNDGWFFLHEKILQHRKQVVSLINAEIERRSEHKERQAAS